ncbi:putative Ig mu chain C region membrane-bound form protein [Naja naja]|nr:putative Ig mu chain C region membrane-bound form protein [Naja naja]
MHPASILTPACSPSPPPSGNLSHSSARWHMKPPTPESTNMLAMNPSRNSSTRINTYLLPPWPKHLYITRNAKIVCMVVNLQQEEGLKISWPREKEVTTHPELVAVTEENNGTFTAVGRLPVSVHDWESGEMFTCSVEYPGLPAPIIKTISKSREKSKAPIIHVYLLIPGNLLILTCLVQGFGSPENDVQWLKNGNTISEDDYVTILAVKEKSGYSSFLYSKLTIPKSSWDRGESFSCEVVHETLETKVTQKSIKKTLEKTIIENNYSTKKEEDMKQLWTTVLMFYIYFLISVCYRTIITLFRVSKERCCETHWFASWLQDGKMLTSRFGEQMTKKRKKCG